MSSLVNRYWLGYTGHEEQHEGVSQNRLISSTLEKHNGGGEAA